MNVACDLLVLAAHPDDAEIGCGGTILDSVARGLSVVIVDMTRGETGTLGTPELRAEEAAAAAARLGVVERVNLSLPDAGLREADPEALRRIVGALRTYRPRVLLAPVEQDVHPDHVATAKLAQRAFFHAGLAKWEPELGAPSRPELVAHYFGNDHAAPTFCVDISAYLEAKQEVIACYASQVSGGADDHRVRKLDVLARAEARDRYFGALVGCEAAEPFIVHGALPPVRSGLGALLSSGFSKGGTP